MGTTTNIIVGDSKFMQSYTIDSINQVNIYPLITNNLSNNSYRNDVPVTKISTIGQVYGLTLCNGKLTNLGTNSTIQPYFEFDNSKSKYSTMFISSFYSTWTSGDGLNKIIFENPITGDSIVMDNLGTYANSLSLIGGYSSTGSYGDVLAVGFKELSSWKTVRIKFGHTGSYIHAWVGFKSLGTGDIFVWEDASRFLIQDNTDVCVTDGTGLTKLYTLPYEATMFNTNGMYSLDNINTNIISKINNNEYKIAMYKKN